MAVGATEWNASLAQAFGNVVDRNLHRPTAVTSTSTIDGRKIANAEQLAGGGLVSVLTLGMAAPGGAGWTLLWLLLGPLAGGFLGEYNARDPDDPDRTRGALRAGFAHAMAILVGTVVKFGYGMLAVAFGAQACDGAACRVLGVANYESASAIEVSVPACPGCSRADITVAYTGAEAAPAESGGSAASPLADETYEAVKQSGLDNLEAERLEASRRGFPCCNRPEPEPGKAILFRSNAVEFRGPPPVPPRLQALLRGAHRQLFTVTKKPVGFGDDTTAIPHFLGHRVFLHRQGWSTKRSSLNLTFHE
jgi:hypothetical protein